MIKLTLPSFAAAAPAKSLAGIAQRSKMMEYDQPLVWVILILMLFGMVMVYSASITTAEGSKFTGFQPAYYLYRQGMFVFIGCVFRSIVTGHFAKS